MTWTDRDLARPVVCGHRGAPAITPENTLASFRTAAERGASWVEFDVRPTSDGALVIHHDPVTAEGVTIGASSCSQLRADIPTFGELRAELPALGLDIEMKTDDIVISLDAFVDLVISEIDTHCSSSTNLMVTSFDAEALAMVRDRRPWIATGLLFWKRSARWAIETAVEMGHVAIAPYIKLLSEQTVEKARANNLDIVTWTVNKPKQVQRAAELGVDMIIGDDPAIILEHLKD